MMKRGRIRELFTFILLSHHIFRSKSTEYMREEIKDHSDFTFRQWYIFFTWTDFSHLCSNEQRVLVPSALWHEQSEYLIPCSSHSIPCDRGWIGDWRDQEINCLHDAKEILAGRCRRSSILSLLTYLTCAISIMRLARGWEERREKERRKNEIFQPNWLPSLQVTSLGISQNYYWTSNCDVRMHWEFVKVDSI